MPKKGKKGKKPKGPPKRKLKKPLFSRFDIELMETGEKYHYTLESRFMGFQGTDCFHFIQAGFGYCQP